jgi:ribosomal protein S18 acetylase RimI-like enzyme
MIRTATLQDLPGLQELVDQLAYSDLPYDNEVDLQWSRTQDGINYLNEKILQKNGVCFIAETDETLIGYSTIAIKKLPAWRKVTAAEIENLYVVESYRKRGIGKELLEACIRWVKDQKIDRISVSVFSGNESAKEFYIKRGLTPYDSTYELFISQDQ